jgi:GT2 family glycosyltransferase
VSVGLVTWNSAAHLPACLNALAEQTHRCLELIAVDNASTDDSAAQVAARYPGAHVVRSPVNTGYCGGHNQAIRAARGRYYLPLNPDVVMTPTYVAALVDELEAQPRFGSAAGKLLQGNGPRPTIDSTGLFIDRKRRQYLRGHGEPDTGRYQAGSEVFGVDGAAPLYRRAMLDDIQIDGEYFDESFFAHKEDVDLAWRAQLLGWPCWYTPQAVAVHPRNFRPGRRAPMAAAIRVHAVKNRYLLLLKNESRAGWRRDGARILAYDLQILAYLLLFERSSLGAFPLLRQAWPRARRWRAEIWRRARRQPDAALQWFR